MGKLERTLVASPRLTAACAFFCFLAALAVFALPYAIPVEFHPAISASYVAGFSNRAAAFAAAAISFAVASWSWRRGILSADESPRYQHEASSKLGLTFIAAAIFLTCCFTAVCGWAIHEAGQRYLADAGYFIEQISKHVDYGGALYSHIEFAYGPLLFYPTMWLQRLAHCGVFAAYFATLAAEQSIGLVELAYILNSLPLRPSTRYFSFLLFSLGAMTPLLGLNYTLFRYLTPIVFLLFAANTKRILQSTLILAAGALISLGISAEIGLAFAVGSAALILWNVTNGGLRRLGAIVGPMIGAVVFTLSVGRAYVHILGAFAKGALNLPVAPYPHLLVFLFVVVWLAPRALGRVLAVPDGSTRSIVCCYAVGIAMLPSALGRCDPLHVFFNGLVLCLLSLVAVEGTTPTLRRLWLTCLLLFVFWQVLATNKLFRFRTADTMAAVLPSPVSHALARIAGDEQPLGQHLEPARMPEYELDVQRLEQSVGHATVATPLEITPETERVLKCSGHFQSSYFAFMVDTFSAPSELRAIAEMNQSEWALVPRTLDRPFIELPRNLQDLQGFSFPLPQRHSIPFPAGENMANNIRKNWTLVDQLGPYVLYKRTENESLSQNALAFEDGSPGEHAEAPQPLQFLTMQMGTACCQTGTMD